MRAKVVHIITMLELGGAQQNTLYTVQNLDRARWEPILISGPGGTLDEEAKTEGSAPVYFVPTLVRNIHPILDAAAFFHILYLLIRLRPEIVHTHSSKAGILGRFAAALAGVPVILHTFHGFGFHDFQHPFLKSIFVFLESLAARISTRLIVVSSENTQKGLAHGVGKPSQYRVVHSGIAIAKFSEARVDREQKKIELGIPVKNRVVAMVACLKPQKAPLDFIGIARRLAPEFEDVSFLLIGDGELRNKIEYNIREYRLGGKIKLPGWRRDMPQIYPIVDILVLTSLWEGLPRAFPEAMAAAVPIVATNVDGAREIIRDGVNGYLAGPRDVEALARRVRELLRDPALAHRMGQAGREALGKDFDIDVMVQKLDDLYQKEISCHTR